MPIYDFQCPKCLRKKNDVFLHKHDSPVCCDCGEDMVKLVSRDVRFVGIDCFPSEGIFLENVSAHGKRFYSKEEMRKYEKANGVTIGMIH